MQSGSPKVGIDPVRLVAHILEIVIEGGARR